MNSQNINLPAVMMVVYINPALRYAPYRLRRIHLHSGVA